MGWNDRLPEDPYTPPPEYYRDRDEYEAWLEYVEQQLIAEDRGGLSSQNINPADLVGTLTPKKESLKSRLYRVWAALLGQNRTKKETRKTQTENQSKRAEDAECPF